MDFRTLMLMMGQMPQNQQRPAQPQQQPTAPTGLLGEQKQPGGALNMLGMQNDVAKKGLLGSAMSNMQQGGGGVLGGFPGGSPVGGGQDPSKIAQIMKLFGFGL